MMLDLYRAEATRTHKSKASKWTGKWKKDVKLAIAQGQRWQRREPFAVIEIASSNGMRATLAEMEQTFGKPGDVVALFQPGRRASGRLPESWKTGGGRSDCQSAAPTG